MGQTTASAAAGGVSQCCSCSSSPSSPLHSEVSGGVTRILVPEGRKILRACSNPGKAEAAVLVSDNTDLIQKTEMEKQQDGRHLGLGEDLTW